MQPNLSASSKQTALDYLARREHSQQELRRKLASKGFDKSDIETSLTELEQAGLQSDTRFAECYVRSRRSAGMGPVRIAMELGQRGVAADIITDAVDKYHASWQEQLESVWRSKYPGQPTSPKDYAKQTRFLAQRGFDHEAIRQLLDCN